MLKREGLVVSKHRIARLYKKLQRQIKSEPFVYEGKCFQIGPLHIYDEDLRLAFPMHRMLFQDKEIVDCLAFGKHNEL